MMLSGLLLVVGGLSGTRVLVGTDSSGALVVVGGAVLLFGLMAMFSRASEATNEINDADAERDEEQYAEYQRARQALLEKGRAEQLRQRQVEAQRLLAAHPAAREEVAATLGRAGEGLSEEQRAALTLDLARRLTAA